MGGLHVSTNVHLSRMNTAVNMPRCVHRRTVRREYQCTAACLLCERICFLVIVQYHGNITAPPEYVFRSFLGGVRMQMGIHR